MILRRYVSILSMFVLVLASAATNSRADEVEKEKPLGVTKEAFDKIQPGMSMEEVEEIIGKKGTFDTSRTIDGRKVDEYSWKAGGGWIAKKRWIDVTFIGGIVQSKGCGNLW